MKLYIQREYYMNITPNLQPINSNAKQFIRVHRYKVLNSFVIGHLPDDG
jgi:hypothetical protein